MNVQNNSFEAEALTPHRFFKGDLEFSGFVQDLRGAVRRHYHGSIKCAREGSTLVLDEVLYFDDGERETRAWHIEGADRPISIGEQMTAKADDLVGDAIITPISQDEMRWTYTMMIEIGGKKRPFQFEDVFVQTEGDTMVARTSMRKFGVTLARLISSYRRVAA